MLRNLRTALTPLTSGKIQLNQLTSLQPTTFEITCRLYCAKQSSESKPQQKKDISKAMRAYLQRATEHDAFMKEQNYEYQIGKRHLANMMGEDPETFSQKDVDEAITYLFPSGLYEKKARPLMRPPEEVFPQRKAAEFDASGKPHHYLFYTGKPNFYEVQHKIGQHIMDLNQFEDAMLRKGLKPDPNLKLELTGYQWIPKDEFEKKIVELIGDKDYASLTNALERLSLMPYSYKVRDFIMEYSRPLMSQTRTYDAPKPQYDPEGRAFVTSYECKRKRAIADVTIRTPGTGKISINGKDITYFEDKQPREQILFPLLFTNLLNKFDVEANVTGGGTSGQAGAIRWGIAWSLRSFVDQEMIEKMRLAGLLTRDVRVRERKKPGQQGARRKFTWKKR